MKKAFAIGQLCYHLALAPSEHRERMVGEMRLTFKMDDEEFDDFRRSLILKKRP